MEPTRILVAEDETSTRHALEHLLRARGHHVRAVANGGEAVAALRTESFDLIVTDLQMPGADDGLSVLQHAREIAPETLVLLVTAHASVETAIEALRVGVADYIQKPLPFPEIARRISSILAQREGLRDRQVRRRKENPPAIDPGTVFVGRSAAMRRIAGLIGQVASTDCTVLITGQSGVGKEVAARAIHELSHVSHKAFVPINCAAIPDTLLESQLFGHTKGSFTGAERAEEGLFHRARGGTLFLDEIGELSPPLQAKLLRAIELKEILPIGAKAPIRIDLRIIASTNRDLREGVKDGRFREDLYYRLKVFGIEIPPLCERREDVPPLVDHLLRRHNVVMKRDYKGVTNATMALFLTLPWKGNVRELDHVIEYAMVVGDGHWITPADLPPGVAGPAAATNGGGEELAEAVRQFEKAHIESVLRESGRNLRLAAGRLGIHLATLYRKLQIHGINGVS